MLANLNENLLTPEAGLSPELSVAGEKTTTQIAAQIAARITPHTITDANVETNLLPILPDALVFRHLATDGQPVTGLTFAIDAVDPNGDVLTFSFAGGEDDTLFSIDPLTGEIRLEATIAPGSPLDADRDMFYRVDVTLSDGQLSRTDTWTIEIDLGPAPSENAAPVLLEPLEFGYLVLDGGETVTGLTFDLQAEDADGDALEFSITGGEDAALFSIDPMTGQIRLEATIEPGAPRDADGDLRYLVEATVSDGQASDTETVAIRIDPGPGPNLPPVLAEPVLFFVPEGTTSAGTLTAFDPEGDAIRFDILPGEDASLFTIDPATGALSFVEVPDFQTPADADGDNVYLLDIGLSDGGLARTSGQVEIHVVRTPAPPPPMPQFDRPAGADPFDVVRNFLTPAVTGPVMDLDLLPDDALSTHRFTLFGEDANRFEIDRASGLVSIREDADLAATGSFDGDPIFEIIAHVENEFGASDVLEIDFLLFQGG